jgi:hypothetical protein
MGAHERYIMHDILQPKRRWLLALLRVPAIGMDSFIGFRAYDRGY